LSFHSALKAKEKTEAYEGMIVCEDELAEVTPESIRLATRSSKPISADVARAFLRAASAIVPTRGGSEILE